MEFAFGQTVYRDRRQQVPDPYNPARTQPGPWSGATSITLDGAYVGPASSVAVSDPTRAQVQVSKSLYCAPSADVKIGDRIRAGAETFEVLELPDAPTNPWTGWQPVLEVPLERVIG